MTLDERITLCRFLLKVEGQEAYCASIGVRDASKFREKDMKNENNSTREEKR